MPAEQRNALAHAIYQADVEFWETLVERTKGNPYVEPPMLRSSQPVLSNGIAASKAMDRPALSEVSAQFARVHVEARAMARPKNSLRTRPRMPCSSIAAATCR